MLELQETILSLLCVVAFMILLWDLLLEIKLKKLEKKVKGLEEKRAIEKKKESME